MVIACTFVKVLPRTRVLRYKRIHFSTSSLQWPRRGSCTARPASTFTHHVSIMPVSSLPHPFSFGGSNEMSEDFCFAGGGEEKVFISFSVRRSSRSSKPLRDCWLLPKKRGKLSAWSRVPKTISKVANESVRGTSWHIYLVAGQVIPVEEEQELLSIVAAPPLLPWQRCTLSDTRPPGPWEPLSLTGFFFFRDILRRSFAVVKRDGQR